jgi:hypothetical protein
VVVVVEEEEEEEGEEEEEEEGGRFKAPEMGRLHAEGRAVQRQR